MRPWDAKGPDEWRCLRCERPPECRDRAAFIRHCLEQHEDPCPGGWHAARSQTIVYLAGERRHVWAHVLRDGNGQMIASIVTRGHNKTGFKSAYEEGE